MTQSLSGEARRSVADIADRHGFSAEAGEAMAEALLRSGGGMAQFRHPDLGGMGQWSKGGMMMIGEMNNDGLKARVGDLARDLSDAVQSGKIGAAEEAQTDEPSSGPSASQVSSSSASSSGGSWWPGDLGRPSSTGSQNSSRYAVFPDRKRLAVEQDGRVTVYDTGEETIEGAAQQQGGGSSMRFSTRSGSVRVEDLKAVDDKGSDDKGSDDDVRAKQPAGPASPLGTKVSPGPQAPASRPEPMAGRAHAVQDPIETLRQLAALRDDGILTEAEFVAKKTELLARL